MSNPKRKVTDLLPSEAILISSDADLKVLDEFEKVDVIWLGGRHRPTEWNPIEKWCDYPFYLYYEKDRISWSSNGINGIPATDFIPTEAEKVEVDEGSTIESVFKLTKWILENRVSSLIDADIPQEDKDRIARHFGYSADLTNP